MTRRPRASMSIRNNEFLGDMAAWKRANSEDNREQLARLSRNLRLVRTKELSPRQEELLRLYYEEGMNTNEIARELGVCSSTVCRTLRRARENIRHYLQYSL